MPIRQPTQPIRFTPRGLSDAFDSTDTFRGACTLLQNLIPDQQNPELMVARPGVGTPITSFAGFTTPGFIEVHIGIGTRVYGMIASGRNAGKSEPFCYDIAAAAFVTISGVTSGNSPTSQASTGDWTPPTMAVVGTKILVTHPGFNGVGSNFFGVIDISTPATPAWSSANTATNALPSVPTAVANFNNRAYYACGNVSYFSDALVPLTRTNASQAITHGDTTAITGYAGLPVSTTSAGVVAALLVFKVGQIWQVTGDTATSNLANNYLSLTVGTSAPRSISVTTIGTFFIADDGPSFVDLLGAVKPLVLFPNQADQDVQVPFQNATSPSRIAGGFAGDVYRACLDTTVNGVSGTYDYWFHMHRKRWSGPHSFPVDCMSQVLNYFVVSHYSLPGRLFASQVLPAAGSVYTDNGASIACRLTSAAFPKDGKIAEKQVVESIQELASAGSTTAFQITAFDGGGNILSSCTITVQGAGVPWGSNTWGDGSVWTAVINRATTYQIPWTMPLVFDKMVIDLQVTANAALAIGTSQHRYQFTGKTNVRAA